jgi:hypothetical protein
MVPEKVSDLAFLVWEIAQHLVEFRPFGKLGRIIG